MYAWLANLVAVTHGLVVVAVVVGSVAAMAGVLRRHPPWERAFYALLAVVLASEALLGECFLTGWEKTLRHWHEPGSAYRGSFIGHYLPFLPRPVRAWAGVLLITGALLALPFWRLIDRLRSATPPAA